MKKFTGILFQEPIPQRNPDIHIYSKNKEDDNI